MDGLTCSICLEDFNDNNYRFKLPCGHEFHTECIITSLRKNNECPYCRDTDGNVKISIYNNNIFNNDDNDLADNNEYIENDNNYKEMCQLLMPCKKNYKNEISELKRDIKKLEKNSVKLLNDFRKKGRELLIQYKKGFISESEYSNQHNDLKVWKSRCNKLKKKFIKDLKQNGIEYDTDVKEMLDNYLYGIVNDDNVWELQNGWHHFFWDLF